jgi:hypothetical protein
MPRPKWILPGDDSVKSAKAEIIICISLDTKSFLFKDIMLGGSQNKLNGEFKCKIKRIRE